VKQAGRVRPGTLARLAPALILLAAAFTWWPLLHLGLYGWDTYPLIAAGRFAGPGELAANLGEELMEGKFPGGRYWRPLVTLSFGLDHALWGMEALGYRASDLVALALGALAVHALARQLLASELGALIAGLVYAVHPLSWELLPLPARRADLWCALFTVLAVGAMAGRGSPRPWRLALWCALAMASKETGVLALPLAAALGWRLHGARAALRALRPAGIVFLVYAALHTWIVGGLGGGKSASLSDALSNVPTFAERYAILLAYPVPWLAGLEPERALVLVVILLAAAFGCLARTRRGVDATPGRDSALALAGIWLLLALLMTAAAGIQRTWYAAAFLPAWALLQGALAARAVRALDPSRVRWGSAALVALGAVLLLELGGQLAFDSLAEKRAAARAAADLVQRFEALVAAAEPGSVLTIDPTPPPGAAVRHGEETERPMTLPPYGLEAYAELRWPERRVRCTFAGADDAALRAADDVLVLLEAP
jgi:hypothetical protein